MGGAFLHVAKAQSQWPLIMAKRTNYLDVVRDRLGRKAASWSPPLFIGSQEMAF